MKKGQLSVFDEKPSSGLNPSGAFDNTTSESYFTIISLLFMSEPNFRILTGDLESEISLNNLCFLREKKTTLLHDVRL